MTRVINGPIPYTPDGNPLLGPAFGLPDFHLACAFSFGIVQAGGAGKAVAEWIVEGAPEWDLWGLDGRRYTGYATQAYVRAKARELYQHEYAIAYPLEERPAGRPARTTPLYTTLAAKGAVFGARGGWERALWFGEATGAGAHLRPRQLARGGRPRNAARCASGWRCSTSAASPSSRSRAGMPRPSSTG